MSEVLRTPQEIVVVGAGMVAHRFVESLISRAERPMHVTVIGDEARRPYDRAALTGFFSGMTPEDLELDRSVFDDFRVRFLADDRALRIDRSARTVTTRSRVRIPYDTLVLATGSYAATVEVDGADLPGCFGYRTLEDVQGLKDFVERRAAMLGRPLRGAVIGGGILGLEAAGALRGMQVETTVVERSDRLMSAQLDSSAEKMLQHLLEARGIWVRTGSRTTRLDPDDTGAVAALEFHDGSIEPADVVVFAIGARPRDELARNAGMRVAPRGGVIIDERCATSDPSILAIGEVAEFEGRSVGLVAPGYAMAEVAATRLLGGDAAFPGYDDASTLNLSGVDVASFGDAMARTPHALDLVYADPTAGVYRKLVLSDDAQTLLGGILVGDATAYGALRPLVGASLGTGPAAYLLPGGAVDVPVDETASHALCAHFDLSHRQLSDAVRVAGLTTFSGILERIGRGVGCDVCKPAIAGMLSALVGVQARDREDGTVQAADGHAMAGAQKESTYSVVPSIAGGEVTPEGLIAIGQIARDFTLETTITGGRRIDMVGARLEQLPTIRQRLIDAGFDSGRVYGTSSRTMQTFAGASWGRSDVLDPADPSLAPVSERGQVPQATRDEPRADGVLIVGGALEARR